MSLRVIHVFVILLSIGVTLFFGAWAVNHYLSFKDRTDLYWGLASLVGAGVLIPYLIWFLIKTKQANIR